MKHLTYKDWSFLFLIFVIILNIVVAFWIVFHLTTADIEYEKAFSLRILILGVASTIFFLDGSILTILNIVKKESKDYKYYFSVIGYPVFLLVSLLI